MDHIFDESQPIYLQILQRLYAKILRGEYKSGEKLPSVMEAAMIFKVNHNTVARVYTEIVRSGVGVTRRGEGTYVTDDQAVLEALRNSMRQTILDNFISEMRSLGYSSQDIGAALISALQLTEDKV